MLYKTGVFVLITTTSMKEALQHVREVVSTWFYKDLFNIDKIIQMLDELLKNQFYSQLSAAISEFTRFESSSHARHEGSDLKPC